MKRYYSGVKLERLGDTIVRFTCPEGHSETIDYSKPKKISQRMGKAGFGLNVSLLASPYNAGLQKMQSQYKKKNKMNRNEVYVYCYITLLL